MLAFDARELRLGRLYDRPELAKLWGYANYRAIARGVVTPAGSKAIVLFVTRQKQEGLTQYEDFISGDVLHWEGEKGHGTDARIAVAGSTGEEIHLFYRDIHHAPFRYYGLVRLLDFLSRTHAPSIFRFKLLHDLEAQDDLATHSGELDAAPETERESLRKARMGQGAFRQHLLELWRGCAVSGIDAPELLRASHIKPWRDSSNEERLNPYNGLLLLPQYDRLFDRGFISFGATGEIMVSHALKDLSLKELGVLWNARLRRVDPQHAPFLEYHRRHVFVGTSGTG